jgi:23S rRNA (cytidine1920-2'-O)/16S rRNA (cytidine1409-2'-O)-methyltransferase
LEKVLPPTLMLLKPGSEILALIKPQFEVGKGQVGKGGVVRDPGQHEQVLVRIKELAAGLGCDVLGVCDSPIRGPKGNREFLIHLLMESGQ